ncbi:CdaR family protein [Candidatus Marinimicrobia bacterium]|nr:CdaR family protein [Candidatus Neomarinimicrobiota bacterium]MDB3883710.1 CdaR family protein [Candidatus Neomarinimicrobiota bacterium]MDB3979989.1 CdaR family protein [Candidatus Neomarinimicrobiota bacterium]
MLTNTNQIKRLLYSFVIAFIFWFFIKSEDTYSVTTSIPLVARNLQEQKTYKEEVPESIIVTLKGSGRAFIWLRFFDNFYEDYKAVIDLSSIADEYNFELDQYYKNNPEKIVLPASLELEFVEVISPRSIKINLDQYLVKKVPIKSEVIVSTAPGYIQAGEEVFFPDSISIGGPQEIVDSINFVKTQKDTLVDLVSSIESEFLIINPDKVVDFDPKKVKGFIDIQPISETIVTGIPVKLINKPNDVNVFVNPATVSLTIVGGLDQIASIVSTDIEVLINFEKSWSADKQFYSPEVRIPDSILEWKDLSPNNLEILVIKEIN